MLGKLSFQSTKIKATTFPAYAMQLLADSSKEDTATVLPARKCPRLSFARAITCVPIADCAPHPAFASEYSHSYVGDMLIEHATQARWAIHKVESASRHACFKPGSTPPRASRRTVGVYASISAVQNSRRELLTAGPYTLISRYHATWLQRLLRPFSSTIRRENRILSDFSYSTAYISIVCLHLHTTSKIRVKRNNSLCYTTPQAPHSRYFQHWRRTPPALRTREGRRR